MAPFPATGQKSPPCSKGIVQAALLAPPADYVALKAGFKRLVKLAVLAGPSKGTPNENPATKSWPN